MDLKSSSPIPTIINDAGNREKFAIIFKASYISSIYPSVKIMDTVY
jgi:hypothetical protein